MKKAIISLAALAFAGAVLASCGGTKSIKAPKKGKAVDSIELKYDGADIKINKNTEFDDAIAAINYGTNTDIPVYFDKDNVTSYRSLAKEETKYSEKNGYERDDCLYGEKSYSKKRQEYYEVYNNATPGEDEDVFKTDVYQIRTNKESTNEKIDKSKSSISSESKEISAGHVAFNYPNFKITGGNYEKKKETKKSNKNDYNNSTTTSVDEYTYIDRNENMDETSGHYSASKGERTYSYSLYDFIPVYPYPYTMDYVDLYYIYDGYYSEYYTEKSFELTEKEIIIKTKTTITNALYDYAYEKAVLENKQVDDLLKSISENEFKGSYLESEIWLSYDENFEENGFTYTYYKTVEKSNYDISFVWTDEFIDRIDVSTLLFGDYVGKEFNRKGSTYTEFAIAHYDFNHNKKIDPFLTKAKKKNIYDGLDFKELSYIPYNPDR